MSDTELRIEPIRAWRAWYKSSNNILMSTGTRYAWIPGEVVDGGDVAPDRTNGVHACPSLDVLVQVLMIDERSADDVVFGQIEMWGTVVEYEKGYRAQFARVISCSDRAIADRYGVDFEMVRPSKWYTYESIISQRKPSVKKPRRKLTASEKVFNEGRRTRTARRLELMLEYIGANPGCSRFAAAQYAALHVPFVPETVSDQCTHESDDHYRERVAGRVLGPPSLDRIKNYSYARMSYHMGCVKYSKMLADRDLIRYGHERLTYTEWRTKYGSGAAQMPVFLTSSD